MCKLISLVKKSNITDDELIKLLPETLANLVGHMTVEDIILVIDKIGGRSITVPGKLINDSFLVQKIGYELSTVFLQIHRNETLSIPRASMLKREIKARLICDMRKRGFHTGEIAKEFDMTERAIYGILSKNKGK